MTKKSKDLGVDLQNPSEYGFQFHVTTNLLFILQEELQVDLEDGLQ